MAAGEGLSSSIQSTGIGLANSIQSTGLGIYGSLQEVGLDLQQKITDAGLQALKSLAGGPAKKKAPPIDMSTSFGQLELIALCALGTLAVVKFAKK